MTSLIYPTGIDLVWLAKDAEDAIGAFITAGEGPIPTDLLVAGGSILDTIESSILELPRMGSARLLVSVKRPDDFVAIAERGLYVYDWRDAHRTTKQSSRAYEQVAVPEKTIVATQLPKNLGNTAVGLANINFSREKSVQIQRVVRCAAAFDV